MSGTALAAGFSVSGTALAQQALTLRFREPAGASQMVLTLENFKITLMLDVAEFARIQMHSAIL